MSYVDEGYNAFMEREDDGLFSDLDFKTQSPLDFDSFVSDSSINSAKVKQITADKIITGTLAAGASISVGGYNIRMNDPTRTIIVNDGTYDRILIGYLKDKF